MKVLCFGSANIDHTYRVDHFTQPGETQSCLSYTVGSGGKGLNQAAAIASAQCETYFAGIIGSDGLFLKETLREKDVNTDYLKVMEDEYTGHAIIEVDQSGQNHIVLYSGTNHKVTKDDVDRVLKHFGSGDIVVLQNEISNVPYIIEQCSKMGMIIIFNAAPYSESVKDYPIEKATWLVVNEIEGEGLSGCSNYDEIPAALKKKYPSTNILFTMGKDGSRVVTNSEDIYQKALDVPVTDTTCAGDTYIGYFVKGLAEQMPLPDAMRLATKASAMAIMKPGALLSIPTFEAVINC